MITVKFLKAIYCKNNSKNQKNYHHLIPSKKFYLTRLATTVIMKIISKYKLVQNLHQKEKSLISKKKKIRFINSFYSHSMNPQHHLYQYSNTSIPLKRFTNNYQASIQMSLVLDRIKQTAIQVNSHQLTQQNSSITSSY